MSKVVWRGKTRMLRYEVQMSPIGGGDDWVTVWRYRWKWAAIRRARQFVGDPDEIIQVVDTRARGMRHG
jgi:hypothetical protein